MKRIFESERAAVVAFAHLAMPKTDKTGREMAALLWRGRDGWRLSRPCLGFHNNVILPVLLLSLGSLFVKSAMVVHTHPNCACHQGECLSGVRAPGGRIKRHGDMTVPGLLRLQGIYCVTPTGELLFYGRDHVCVRLAPVVGYRLTTIWASRLKGLLPSLSEKYTMRRT